jgi:hypothetical protein
MVTQWPAKHGVSWLAQQTLCNPAGDTTQQSTSALLSSEKKLTRCSQVLGCVVIAWLTS